MAQDLHAARKDDLILHPPLMAELTSALTEAVVYAAATAAVGAALGAAVAATIGTGGAAAALVPVAAGLLVGAASSLPGGGDKSIGEHISDFSDWVGNSLFPPEPYGAILTGSANVHINGVPAARAAGISLGVEASPDTPEPPSILENVGAYAMLGASMMLPIIGMAQDIASIFNPPITTPADPGTQERGEDTITCSKHPAKNFLAQGSDKVFINGQPAVRVGDKTTCDGPVGMTFSPNVRIGGGTLTVRDIRDGKSALAKIIGIVAGMLLSRRGGKARSRPGKAPKPKSMIPKCKGHPVIVSSGAKLLDGPDDLDFALPGLLPIEWARRYDSNDTRGDGVFGLGWSLPYEVCIERVPHPEGGELWIYVDEEGTRIELGRMQPGSALVSSLDGLAFFHQDAGITVVEDIYSGQYQVLRTDPHDSSRSRLVQLGDRNLNRLDLLYDNDGRLQYLVDTFGRTVVELLYHSVHPRRVGQVQRLFLREGNDFMVERRETLATYTYTPAGQLSEVHEPGGQVLRRFSYTPEGLMASHTLASGATFHYQWQRFAAVPRPTPNLPPLLEPQPAHEWRVIRHWSEDGEDYHFHYDLAQSHTEVTDSLGRKDHFEWGPLHEVLVYVDPLGQRWQEEVVQGQLLASIDPQGAEWRYHYDALGRLIESHDPLGRCERTTYTEHWALPTHISDGAGRTYRNAYDTRGNLISTTDPLGRTTRYRHDRQGRVEQVTDAQGKTRQLEWNARGQLIRYSDCSNRTTLWRYDERGHLSEVFNGRNNRTRYRFDARGHLLESTRADGRVDRYQVNLSGQLTQHIDPGQQLTQWHYDKRGRLSQRTDAMGLTLRFAWDAHDRLQRLENENGEHYAFHWDALDRLAAQHNLDGGGHSYRYDAAGNVIEARLHPAPDAEPTFPGSPPEPEASIQSQYFEYDDAGRLLRKRTDDGVTDYEYDLADNLLAITFTNLQSEPKRLAFSHDALGQLLSETGEAGRLAYEHDELGNLQTLTLPDGRRLNHLYYGSGHLHQLNLDGRVICDFERDELHAEVLRTQGRIQTRTRYDSTGRLLEKALHVQGAGPGSLALLSKQYRYDDSDNLIGEDFIQCRRARDGEPTTHAQIIGRLFGTDASGNVQRGQVRYDYGPTERIHGASRTQPHRNGQQVEHYGYDKAGNLLDGYPIKGYVRHNRLKVYQDKRYRYDRFGRLSEKRTGAHLIQRFEYDAEHRLVRVHQQRGPVHERVEFDYDPLGRRTAKRLYRNDLPTPVSQTLFLWQGLRLLQEIQDDKPSLYVYADSDSYDPLARLDGAPGAEQLHYFHTNLAGLPEQLTDENGVTVWHGEFETWGKCREEWHHAGQNRQQNLRFQGQYLDRETGLHYNTFRFYDPEVGRFTQQDPIGLIGGVNLYQYGANTASCIDPLGLSGFDPFEHGELTDFPKDLHFGQNRAAPQFSSIGAQVPEIAGRPVLDVADDLRTNKLSPDKLLIAYTKDPVSGKYVTLNNRGLAALVSANKYPKYAIFVPYQHAPPHLTKDFKNKPPSKSIDLTRNKDGSGLVTRVSPCP
ncbi:MULTISPECIES: RHS repeat-associated core domain-containing protein [unclassified Pseudomonas]|uniref:RHS repeat-associated core domain-containing protein n=1 Tax=unclassified Pseudomonas TaxID=196821 RepID=UPI0009E83C6E|nr:MULTISPECIES: RHS repeat-associated core domain-containing protein [unclassified Pseudomonas]